MVLLIGIIKKLFLHWALQALERSVSIILDLFIVDVNIDQTEVFFVTVGAFDTVVFVFFGFLSLPSYAETADVIVAAVRNENVIEVT